jgi:hypothetical protein
MAEDLEAIPSSLSVLYSTTKELQSILREILRRMKLEHLYLIHWDIHDGTYLDFYNGRVDPRFSATVRGKPAEWDLKFVGDSFQLPMEGHGFFNRMILCLRGSHYFFKLIKNILLAKQIKIPKFKKGILRYLEATEGLNTSD